MTAQGSDEERAERAEKALHDALEERSRLWHELQELRSAEQDVAYWRQRTLDIERSRWWRAGFPLRYMKRFLEDPAGMLEGRAHAIRRRRRGE